MNEISATHAFVVGHDNRIHSGDNILVIGSGIDLSGVSDAVVFQIMRSTVMFKSRVLARLGRAIAQMGC